MIVELLLLRTHLALLSPSPKEPFVAKHSESCKFFVAAIVGINVNEPSDDRELLVQKLHLHGR